MGRGGNGRSGAHPELAACRSGRLTTFRSLPSASTFLSASSWSRMVFCSSGAFAPLTTATSFPPCNRTDVLLKPQETQMLISSRTSGSVQALCLGVCPRSGQGQGQGPSTPGPQPQSTSLPCTPGPSFRNFLQGNGESAKGGTGCELPISGSCPQHVSIKHLPVKHRDPGKSYEH